MTNLPAYLQTAQTPRLAERTVSNLGAAAPPYVSIAGNRFTLVDAIGAEEAITTVDQKTGMFYLDAVVIDALERESKIFYAKNYDPNSSSFSPPDCWSDNGIAPSRNAGTPQSPTCAACPQAEWGSKISKVSGKGVPACGKYQKLALMIPGDEVVFLLRVPPNSLTHLRDYLHKFNGQQADVKDVITRITFAKEGVGTLLFSAVNYIDEATFKQREQTMLAKGTDMLVGRGDLPREGLPTVGAQRQIGAQPEARVDPTQGLPSAPSAAGRLIDTGPAQTQTASPAAAASPSSGRRKRRTQAEIAADNAQVTAPISGLAPFRPAPQPNGPGASFGIAEGVAPNPELAATLDSIFK